MPESQVTAPPLWGRMVRVLHGALAVAMVICFATAWAGPPAAMAAHAWAGAGVAVVLVLRLAWGVWGPPSARFVTYPLRPADLLVHLRAVAARRAAHWPGHPPLGALMVVLLLAGAGGLVITGAVALGGQEQSGPFAPLLGFATGHAVAEVHEMLALLVAVAVAGHLIGVAVESRLMGENLARSMLTGRRRHAGPGVDGAAGRPRLALVAAGGVLAAGIAAALAVSAAPPLAAAGHAAPPPAYAAECGACHMAYPPALLPVAGWQAVMADLGDHFGEDASLPAATTASLGAWLSANAAETWDSKAGHTFRRLDSAHPQAITATPGWLRRHRKLPETAFTVSAVGSKGNCRACHQDALTGRFAKAAVALPSP